MPTVETNPRLTELSEAARPEWVVMEWEDSADAEFFALSGGGSVIGRPVYHITVRVQRVNDHLAGASINRLRLEAESMSADETQAMVLSAIRGLTDQSASRAMPSSTTTVE